MIITMPLFLAGMQIGGGLASEYLKKKNPKLARNINTFIGSFTAGAQGADLLAGAFKSPSTGLKIGKGTKGVGPLANADEYISGLTGSIADKTQQNFSGWSMDKGFLGDTFKSKQASLFDPYSGLLG